MRPAAKRGVEDTIKSALDFIKEIEDDSSYEAPVINIADTDEDERMGEDFLEMMRKPTLEQEVEILSLMANDLEQRFLA